MLGLLLAPLALLHFFWWEPGRTGFFLPCLVHAATGWYCPGCGAQRALHALLHGGMSEAAGFNLLFVLGLPLIGLLALDHLLEKRPVSTFLGARPGLLLPLSFGVLFLFTLLRNLPWPPFNALAP